MQLRYYLMLHVRAKTAPVTLKIADSVAAAQIPLSPEVVQDLCELWAINGFTEMVDTPPADLRAKAESVLPYGGGWTIAGEADYPAVGTNSCLVGKRWEPCGGGGGGGGGSGGGTGFLLLRNGQTVVDTPVCVQGTGKAFADLLLVVQIEP